MGSSGFTYLLIYLTYFGASFILSPSFRLDIYQMTSSKPDDVKRVGESTLELFFFKWNHAVIGLFHADP